MTQFPEKSLKYKNVGGTSHTKYPNVQSTNEKIQEGIKKQFSSDNDNFILQFKVQIVHMLLFQPSTSQLN